MKLGILAGALALCGLAGNALAATATCPPIQAIKQAPMDGGGFAYQSPGPTGSGQQWNGDNEEAKENFLADSRFTDASYKASTNAVICSYEGAGDAGLRVVLKKVNGFAAAAGTAWNGEACAGQDTAKCAFNYSSVTAP
ncbi:hypothetical protein [Pseudomonas sp. NPDC089534]|uniref:hypothetical protein n=1 Tax=Pseudomonas sp. NPDC089534 TaxID=3364468 RepID=UPI0037F1CA6F